MAFAYDRLTEITTISSTAGAVLTNAASTTSYVRLITIHNTNSTNETVTVYNVPDNAAAVGSAAVTNQFWKDTLVPNETITMEFAPPGLVLKSTNDTIQAVTSTASKVTIQIMGGTE